MAGACREMRFGGMTREVWECLRKHVRGKKVPLGDADAGTIVHPDAAATYAWSEADGTLRVTIIRKPVWLPCEAVEYRLRDAVRDCGGE